MMLELQEKSICQHFDRLIDEGHIIYSKDYRTIPYSDNGFSFEFRLLKGLDKKPAATSSDNSSPLAAPAPSPGYKPGSDIDVSGYEVTDLGTTHMLALNKYASARPHMLVLTQDGFRRQHEALDINDFSALWQVLNAFQQRRYLAIFNCGIDSGCSRLHKHMQVFPAPDSEQFILWPDSDDDIAAAMESSLPFKCFVQRFESGFPGADELVVIYRGLLGKAETALGTARREYGGKEAVPHNVVLDRRWMVVVPRRRAGLGGADANAAAFLGMVWVADEAKMRCWTDKGPASVLSCVALPNDEK